GQAAKHAKRLELSPRIAGVGLFAIGAWRPPLAAMRPVAAAVGGGAPLLHLRVERPGVHPKQGCPLRAPARDRVRNAEQAALPFLHEGGAAPRRAGVMRFAYVVLASRDGRQLVYERGTLATGRIGVGAFFPAQAIELLANVFLSDRKESPARESRHEQAPG